MEDLIKREDAIKAIVERFMMNHSYAERMLEDIPSAEKQGEWINDTRHSGWTCSICDYHDGNKTDNYCPNCGAKMKG